MTCPGESELARAITAGADGELEAHLADCAICRDAWGGAKAVIDLARELPVAISPQGRREEVRTAVLAAAARTARRPARRVWIAPVVAAVAAGVVGYVVIPRGSPPRLVMARHAHGIVHPHPGARYLASSFAPDEIIQLSEGVIDVEVEPLHAGERFRVAVGNAELEVRGTAFTVAASAEHLVEVAVSHGRVDVRPGVGTPSTLAAGQSWRAPRAVPVAAVPPPVVESRPPPPQTRAPNQRTTGSAAAYHLGAVRPREARPATAVSEAPARRTPPAVVEAPPPPAVDLPRHATAAGSPAVPPRAPEEVSYDEAWEALRANNFNQAATGFSRVLLLAPDSSLVEDASFWRAVALARGKRSAEALSAFREFLDGYARSARAGEASAMLGWILIDARAYDEAARRFRVAVGDPSPAVRDSAQAGLDALARREHPRR